MQRDFLCKHASDRVNQIDVYFQWTENYESFKRSLKFDVLGSSTFHVSILYVEVIKIIISGFAKMNY